MSNCTNAYYDPDRAIAIEAIALRALELREAIFKFGDDKMIIAADLVIGSIGKAVKHERAAKKLLKPETSLP